MKPGDEAIVVRYSYLCIASWAKSMELPVLLQVAGLHALNNYDHRDTCIVRAFSY